MSRLTIKPKTILIDCIDCIEQEICCNNTCNAIGRMIDKLAEYENLEEQGLLLRLPYSVGTPIYFVFSKQGVVKDKIRRWQFNNKGLLFCSNGFAYSVDVIGKSIFLTEKEAEQRLRELQGE